MTTLNGNKVKQTIGFLSMTIAWALMNLFYSVYLVWKEGKADDIGVNIFWSGLFILIAWALFIVYPLRRLNGSSPLFSPKILPFVTAVYGALAYFIIVGGLFQSMTLVMMFLPLALLTGLLFGIGYALLIRSHRLVNLLERRPPVKLVCFLSPVILLFIFLKVLPAIAPSLVFRYMPDEIRDGIVARTIPKYKVGDKMEALKSALPGYFDEFNDQGDGMSASMPGFAFVLQVHCGKIIRLEYGKSSSDFDSTIYGKLEEAPCP